MTGVEIQKFVVSIGDSAFCGCSKLSDVVIQDGVTNIGTGTFENCNNLVSVTIPKSVIGIGNAAFSGCEKLNELVFPVSLNYLGMEIVYGCSNLPNITYRGTQAQWVKLCSNSNSEWKKGWNGTVICLDTPTEQPDEPDKPNVPFGRMDKEVRIIVMGENRKYFSFDTSSETKISKAIYRRNEQVEKRLGISLKMIDVHSSNFCQRIRASQLVGEFAYDLAALPSELSSFAIEGFFYNIMQKENCNYIDLSHSWYNQRYVEAAPINGVLPFVTGGMTPETWDHTSAMYYNKDLSDAYDYPLTEIVREARWTIEIMREMTREVHNDINENGVFDEGDLGGLAIASASDCCALLYATGFQIAGRDENNAVTLSFSQRNSDAASHLYQIYTDKTNTFWNASDSSITRNVFIGGQAMLLCDTLGQASKIKDAKFNYGILPLPRYNAAQVDYISVPSSVSLIGVLCNNDISASTAILEVMGYYSQLEILPAYKTSFGLADQENLQMLGIVLESITPNFETVWYSVGISEGILTQIQSGSAFTDFWKKNSAVYNKKLSDLASELGNMQ